MIIIGYFLIASIVFLVWFQRFWNDTSTSKKDLISWVALVLGPLFWPVVLPFSLWQISGKNPEVESAKYDAES
jgi:phosphoglycerol transferase MdoB-like AlkP superfamily enzyme